ncbi:MAG TPA: hypothetical protein VFS83_06370 [Ktedonobacterales bacterium]|nr:hypothetical protein [Ktedonobacterales bacterium]
MELATFDNDTGEGVVSFDPPGWYTYLTIGGERVFEFGNFCGTCGIVFRKIGSVANRISDTQAAQLLGDLDAIPPPDVLRRLARVLQPGAYYPSIVTGPVQLIAPGAANDYFATDVVRLFGRKAPDARESAEPGTAYYRLGVDRHLDRTGRSHGPHQALITAVVMPLQDPSQLNHERIEYWKHQHRTGRNLTAFAVAVLDNQAPAMDPADNTYPFEEQFLLTLCTLDGHHRIQAAAELGASVRILSLLSMEFSLAYRSEDIAAVLSSYAP